MDSETCPRVYFSKIPRVFRIRPIESPSPATLESLETGAEGQIWCPYFCATFNQCFQWMKGRFGVELREGLMIVVVPIGFGEQRRIWKLPPHRVAPKRATSTTLNSAITQSRCSFEIGRRNGRLTSTSFFFGSWLSVS